MNLRIFESTGELVRAAARTIVQRAALASSCAIALSGGSTPKPLYELLGRSPWSEELSQHEIIWVVLDERYVPVEDPLSNSGMIQRTLFASGISPKHQFLRFRTELGNPASTAEKFEEEWRDVGITEVDLAILGVGSDGHTASLFPGTEVLAVDDRIASEVFVPRLNAWRVTLTKPVIRAAKLRIVLAAGPSKRDIIREVREGADYPITAVTSGDIETWWFVDREAVPA